MEISSSSSIIPPISDVIVLFIISITFERYNKNRSYASISLLAVVEHCSVDFRHECLCSSEQCRPLLHTSPHLHHDNLHLPLYPQQD